MNRIASLPDPDRAGTETVSPLLDVSRVHHRDAVTDVTALADGETAVLAFGDGSVLVSGFACNDGPADAGLKLHTGPCIASIGCGKGFFSAGRDGRLYHVPDARAPDPALLWHANGDRIASMAVRNDEPGVALAAGRSVILVGTDGAVRWRASLPSPVTGLCFDRDFRRLAVGHDGGVAVLMSEDGKTAMRLDWKGCRGAVTWSPDMRFIVAATRERELHVWDLPSTEDFRIGGYPHNIHRLTWSACGRYMSCSGADAITVWPFPPVGRIPLEVGFAADATVSAVAAHPRRPLVAGGFTSGTILVGATGKGEALLAAARTGVEVTGLAWSGNGRHLIAGDTAGNVTRIGIPDALGIE